MSIPSKKTTVGNVKRIKCSLLIIDEYDIPTIDKSWWFKISPYNKDTLAIEILKANNKLVRAHTHFRRYPNHSVIATYDEL